VHADVSPPGFYGVNNKTKKRTYRPLNDPHMKGAQCLAAGDYKAAENWTQQVIEIANRRCK
jgi:hypothetical protein